jgi:glycosyltransferase 2 family protein
MQINEKKNINRIKPSRIILPMLIGLGVVGYFISKDIHKIDFSIINFSFYAILFLLICFLLMLLRDIGYIIRLRVLCSNDLSWWQCVRIIFLWEFGSAITPSAIGGTGLATFLLWKEGLSIGKSTSVVMATSFLDELYFSFMFPLLFFSFPNSDLFIIDGAESYINQFLYFALAGYSIKLLWTMLMAYSLFINPRFIGVLSNKIFSLKVLKRWRRKALSFSSDFKESSKELKTKPFSFWFKAGVSSFVSWTSRYWILNFLILALICSTAIEETLISISFTEHLLIFARQLIMWIMMIIMPTPGGSGFIEAVFLNYMADFIPVVGFVGIMALVWRLVTYYPYLIIGAIISPKWINKHFLKD